ncbi:hypothetical protein D9Q98_005178 [Chlorella vulgaris]|uniref:Phospholipase D n=1 Tax=Chlorella vulgaris TaxID=3077 RepID=A0A9D4YWR1_CHLVU|nr:hypothetical protein D9Q98_005178 [Chlorella vulgaris]
MGGSDLPTTGFLHGVASFDPLPDAVLIWTRFTPAGTPKGSVAVEWQVSETHDFAKITASGVYNTDDSRDFTVSVDVTGLQDNRRYYYTFTCGQERSVMGITKTAAAGPLENLVFATVSCCNWGFGYFHVYDLLSKVDELDFVVHCGDYIYEYSKGYYPGKQFQARHGLRPKHKLKSLEDYRQRYACHRTDKGLQELHRRVPMIAVWDDHEIADSAWSGGSEDFKGSKEEWERQKYDAIKAYVEWVPIRGMQHDKIDLQGCNRSFKFGDLATIMLAEGRLSARSEPVDMKETAFYKETAGKDMKEWNDSTILAAKDDLMKEFASPERSVYGPKQIAVIEEAVKESVAAKQPWQVMITQVVMAQIKAPKLSATVNLQPALLGSLCKKALSATSSDETSGREAAELGRMYQGMGKYGVPMNPDAMDGHAAERAKIMKVMNIPGSNPVFMAGDSHNAWAHEISDEFGNPQGVEFDCPAVTCIGAFEDIYCRFEEMAGKFARLLPLFLFTPWIEDSLKAANPDSLQYCNLDARGFVLCHLTKAKFHTEFHFVSNVQKKKYSHFCGATFAVKAGERGQMHRAVRYMSIDGSIPKSSQPKRTILLRSVRDISRRMHQSG